MSGFSNTLHGTVPHRALIDESDDTPLYTKYEPLGLPGNPIFVIPVTAGATEIYSRVKPPMNVSQLAVGDQFKVNGQPLHVRIIADGVKGENGGTPYDSDDIAALINLTDVGDAADIAADQKLTLRNVVLINGQPITPVGNDIDVGTAGSQFNVVDNSGVMELYLEKLGGGVYAEGTCIDVFMDPSNDQIVTTAIAASQQGIPHDILGAHFWRADADAVLRADPA